MWLSRNPQRGPYIPVARSHRTTPTLTLKHADDRVPWEQVGRRRDELCLGKWPGQASGAKAEVRKGSVERGPPSLHLQTERGGRDEKRDPRTLLTRRKYGQDNRQSSEAEPGLNPGSAINYRSITGKCLNPLLLSKGSWIIQLLKRPSFA